MEWFEDEDFWLNYGPVMFDEQHWAEAPGVAKAIFKIADLRKGDAVLDVCCGPGRIAVEMAALGAKVTGVDITQAYLDAAAESAGDEGVSENCEFLNVDMRNFRSDKKFQLAYNVYNSFGYCDSISDDEKILESVFESLADGGTFILECISRESAIKYFTEGEWFERAGKTVLTEFSVVGAWEGLRSKWILIDSPSEAGSTVGASHEANVGAAVGASHESTVGATQARIEHEFVQRLYSAADLRDRLLKIGFKEAEVFGGWDLKEYDQNLSTMVIVARK